MEILLSISMTCPSVSYVLYSFYYRNIESIHFYAAENSRCINVEASGLPKYCFGTFYLIKSINQ
jgi:hypothetical protein